MNRRIFDRRLRIRATKPHGKYHGHALFVSSPGADGHTYARFSNRVDTAYFVRGAAMKTYNANIDDPYSSLICLFMEREFPRRLPTENAALLELLTDAIVATKSVRFGPKPPPESLVEIRNVIRAMTAIGAPIPFMVPWGSEKPDGSSIDIAEVVALKTIKSLHDRIKSYYEPGAEFAIRLEDVSAPHLFVENPDAARSNAARYTDAFKKLVFALELDKFIVPRPESAMTTEQNFNSHADRVLPVIETALLKIRTGMDGKIAEAARELESIGWRGNISPVTINYYVDRYRKLYPERTLESHLSTLARYFAGSLARAQLKIRGDLPRWNGQFLDLAFVEPTPGVNLFGRRVHYRTMPIDYTSNHIAPWRAKGYLRISNDNEVTPKLANFHEQQNYIRNSVVIERYDVKVAVQTDYVLV